MTNKPLGIFLRSYCCPTHGYGNLAVRLARHLIKSDVRLRIQHLGREINPHEIPDDLKMFATTGDNPFPWEVLVAPPDFRVTPGKRAVYFTMWESTRLHPAWVDQFNRCDAIIVPSDFCKTTFDACGVDAPIYKVPLGIDRSVFYPSPEPRDLFVFGASGRTSMQGAAVRKNIDTLIEAFSLAFPDDDIDTVLLEIKLSPKCKAPSVDDPRIRFFTEDWSEKRLARWYNSLSAFASTARGEGFGLHLLEAMSCGVPVITTKFSGVSEYINEQTALVVPHTLVPAQGIYQGLGLWGEPDLWSLVDRMRQVADGGAGVKRIADNGYRAAQSFSWEDTCERIHQILKEVGVFAPPIPKAVLPSGIPVDMVEQPYPEEDEFAEKFGIGKSRGKTMPDLPESRGSQDDLIHETVVVGPDPEGCGVGQYAREVAKACDLRFVGYGHMGGLHSRTVILHHHRNYWEKLPLNEMLYSLYSRGTEIILDVHDPGGIELLDGYVSKVIYHTVNFDGYIDAALPNAEKFYVPLMCPEIAINDMDGATLNRPDTKYVVGWFGLMGPHKGLSLLMAAVSTMRKRGLDIGLLAFGAIADIDKLAEDRSREAYQEAKSMTELLKIEEVTTLYTGFMSYAAIGRTLLQCDCFCLPYTTNNPGQSSAVLPFLYAGKPIIVSNVLMFTDIIGTCAKPLDELSPECIANTVQYMLTEDHKGRDDWSRRAADEYARRRPDVVAKMYRDVIDAAPQPSEAVTPEQLEVALASA